MAMRQQVGLTARDMSDMDRLAQFAANPRGTMREEIFLAVASLYRVQGFHLNGRERLLMQDILRRLSRDVQTAIRVGFAEQLADDTSAPHDLILLLAGDEIAVARPLILRSSQLTETDLVRMIAENDEAHHEAIAVRAQIGETVTDALVRSDAEPVLMTLARNPTARISLAAFEALVEKSKAITALQPPLARRADLPPALATKLCEFVPEALKISIVRNLRGKEATPNTASGVAEGAVKSEPQPAEGAQKLIDKLAISGQLRAGFLLRVLHQGQIDLFDLAFARLLNISLAEQRHKFYETGPKSVALACRAAGIDRCVFATVFNLSRQARNMRPNISPSELAEVQAVFASFTRAGALSELQAA
jgi:uncharacterized protein (DUF2336 family)